MGSRNSQIRFVIFSLGLHVWFFPFLWILYYHFNGPVSSNLCHEPAMLYKLFSLADKEAELVKIALWKTVLCSWQFTQPYCIIVVPIPWQIYFIYWKWCQRKHYEGVDVIDKSSIIWKFDLSSKIKRCFFKVVAVLVQRFGESSWLKLQNTPTASLQRGNPPLLRVLVWLQNTPIVSLQRSRTPQWVS